MDALTPYYQDEGVTIFQGDCRNILPLLPDHSVTLILTDPPYGHSNGNGDLMDSRVGVKGARQKPMVPILNDGVEAEQCFASLLHHARRLLTDHGCCCCCCAGGGGPDPQFARWIMKMSDVLNFKMCVVWDKRGRGNGLGWHYRREWECVLVAEQKHGKSKWIGEGSESNVVSVMMADMDRQHPNQKPIGLMRQFILRHSEPGDTILDPFMGSGTTLIAAKETGRKAIGIELDQRWTDIAISRLRQGVLA